MNLSKLNPLNLFKKKQSSSASASGTFPNTSDGSKYPNGLSGNSNLLYIHNKAVRQNARTAFHDTPEAKGIVARFADTVVDQGLKLECTPMADILGISDDEAETWARDVENRFHLWAMSKKVDRRELRNFYQIQRLYQICQQRDNDIFTRFYYSKERNISNPLQMSILDPNQICGDSLTSTYAYSTSSDGIMRDKKGVESAYKVSVKDPQTGEIVQRVIPKTGRRSGKTMMLHAFSPEYPGQVRGYSRLEHILQEFNEITDFKISTVKKAIAQSQITMYTKPTSDNNASNPFEDIGMLPSGPSSSNNLPDSPATEYTAPECDVTYNVIPEASINSPGTTAVFNLKNGEDLKPFPTQATSESFNEFIEAYMSYVSSSTGMPLEVLLMKFGQNYSASRGALLLFWRVVGIFRAEMEADLLNPAYESWLEGEIAAGRVSAPGFSDPVMRGAWLSNRWIGAPMPNIDPMRTAKADQTYVEMGATNLDRVARDLNGSDGASNRRKLARQFDELPTPTWNRKESNGGE